MGEPPCAIYSQHFYASHYKKLSTSFCDHPPQTSVWGWRGYSCLSCTNCLLCFASMPFADTEIFLKCIHWMWFHGTRLNNVPCCIDYNDLRKLWFLSYSVLDGSAQFTMSVTSRWQSSVSSLCYLLWMYMLLERLWTALSFFKNWDHWKWICTSSAPVNYFILEVFCFCYIVQFCLFMISQDFEFEFLETPLSFGWATTWLRDYVTFLKWLVRMQSYMHHRYKSHYWLHWR